MEEAINPYPNLNLNQTQPKKNKISPNFIAIVVLIVAIVVSFLILIKPKKTEVKKDVVVENNTPSPTSRPLVDKKIVKIQVQNGTGTPGQAGLVVKALESAGFLADNIKTGNAESYDNKTTIITTKDSFAQVVNDIENSLKTNFNKFAVGSPNLGSTSEFDVVIVTGGKIYEEVTPTLTLTPTPTP